jgi:hypothetical protein
MVESLADVGTLLAADRQPAPSAEPAERSFDMR